MIGVLIWAYFTKQRYVRKKLLLASAFLMANPFLSASLFAILQTQCRIGHIDQPFSQCGNIPEKAANYMFLIAWTLTLLPAATLAIMAFAQEFTWWKKPSNLE